MKVLTNTLTINRRYEPEGDNCIDLEGDLSIELTAQEMLDLVQTGDVSELANEAVSGIHVLEAKLTNGGYFTREKEIASTFIFDLEIERYEIV